MSDKNWIFIKYLYIIIAFGFMIYYLLANWHQLGQYTWRINYGLLVISIILTWIGLLGPVIVFKIIFSRIAAFRFRFPVMFKIFNLSFIGRYLPGKLWSVVGMVYYAKEYGINKRISFTAVVINEVCFKGSGLLLGLFYLVTSLRYASLSYLAGIIIVAGLIVIHPRILNRILNYVFTLLKRDRIEVKIGYAAILGYFMIHLIFWGIFSLSFYFLVQSVHPVIITNPLKFAAIFPLAWSIGYLAIFIPGGIGVREGILVALLSDYLIPEIALVIALIQRAISIFLEGMNALISLTIKK
jgi:flagellar biosynthesis protein FliQ